jgi:hypothetical protein
VARKSAEPLEKKDVILFAGDWDELAALLAPFKIKPTVFIRQLVRKKLAQIKSAAAEQARPTPELQDDDLDFTGLAAESSDTREPE